MKFTLSTKPLQNVIGLGIIKANISPYFARSASVQLTATRDTLKLNVEAIGIKTRMVLKGSGDTDETVTDIVDCQVFKGLIDSIDNDVITIEFLPQGISVHAGRSNFSIPRLSDAESVQLEEPKSDAPTSDTIMITAADWQFVRDHQMYAVSTSDAHPVYRNVWVGEDHGVIVGDYDIGMFTYSKHGSFNTSCILPTSLINLFTSIPEGSTITQFGDSYGLSVETDSYSMFTEFTPKYESDSAVGSYNSEIILKMFTHPDVSAAINIAPLLKFMNQMAIVTQPGVDKLFNLTVGGGTLTLSNRVSSYSMPVDTDAEYSVTFLAGLLKKVLANLDSDEIHMAPVLRTTTGADGQPSVRAIGGLFWTDEVTAVLAGQG